MTDASSATTDRGRFPLGGDLSVRRLGFGAMRVTGEGVWGEPRDREQAIRLLRRAVELGIELIDTADSYGPEVSERLIAEALYPYPTGLVIATKGGFVRPGAHRWTPDGRPSHLKQACEASLKRLRLERVDLYQLHTPDPRVPFEESVGALAELRAAGKIRHVGLSNVSVSELHRARTIVPIVSVQNYYNIFDRSSDDVLELCEREGIAFIPYCPLAEGSLSRRGHALSRIAGTRNATRAQVALAWLLHRSPVMIPIPGTASLAHLEENMVAAALHLGSEELKQLN